MPVLKHFQINVVGVDDKGDSPLSMAASVVGIFTFAIALLGAMWLWVKLAVKAREELRVVEETRQWHSKETTWLDTSILAENARGPQHISNLAAEKIKDIQKKLDLPRHLESLQQQKQKAIIMIQSLSKELQSLDGKLPRILQRTTTSQSTASERRRRTATALTTGGVHGVLHFSDLFYEGMTDAAEKVSAANRLLWLPFRSDALDTIKQMEEMRNRLLFVQLAMLDMRMVDNELRAATHERLLLEIWKLLMGLNEAQTGEAEASDFSVRTGQNGNGLANDTCES